MYVAQCPEVGTVDQGETLEEVISNLKEATRLYLETTSIPETTQRFINNFEVEYVGKIQR